MSRRPSRKKDVPYFSGYLKWLSETHKPVEGWPEFFGCVSVLGGTILAAALLRAVMSTWAAVGGSVIVFGVLVAIFSSWMSRRKSGQSAEEKRREQVHAASKQLTDLQTERKLHKWMDPTILQLLEAAAYHWTRLKAALDSPSWSRPDLGQHWLSIKNQSWLAANHAMEELLLMSISCIGEPSRDKQKAVKDMMSDFKDLDVVDALQGLSKIASGDWQDYAYHSPQAQAVFEPGRQIAERIKALADEIERTSTEMPEREFIPTSSQGAMESLDVILGEIRAVREAETELHQQNKA